MAPEELMRTNRTKNFREIEEKECASSIFGAIVIRDILSFPQLSYYTGCAPSLLQKGLHILIDDRGIIKSEKDQKLKEEFYTLSDKGVELKNSSKSIVHIE